MVFVVVLGCGCGVGTRFGVAEGGLESRCELDCDVGPVRDGVEGE